MRLCIGPAAERLSLISGIVNDVNLVQGALTRVPSSLVQGITTMAALTVYIIYLNWRLAAFSLIVLPFAGFALSRFSRRFRRTSTQMQEQVGERWRFNLIYSFVVRPAFCMEESRSMQG